ncbi:MAG: hypothetical protein QOE70_3917 [Chthoniobacter sp.]|nr:hypothetical protein [Chthoniobacter sp.]
MNATLLRKNIDRWIYCAGTLLVMLSLGARGGLPKGGERTASTAVWVTREGDQLVRYNSEPEAGVWKRLKAPVISWLPIEWLL